MSDDKILFGTVVSCKFNMELTSGFGFIAPDHSTGRDDHVLFASWAAREAAKHGAPIQIGDRVGYTLKRDPRGGKDIVRTLRPAPPRSEVA